MKKEVKMNKKITNGFWIMVIVFSFIGIVYVYQGGFTGKVITGISSFDIKDEPPREIIINESLNASKVIKIKSIQEKGKLLNISFSFDPSSFIGDENSVDIWILNSNRTEIKRYQDIFSIRHEGLINRRISVDLRNYPAGVYYIYFALSSNTVDFVTQSFILGESLTTGKTIMENPKNKMIGYGIFLLIIAIAVFFIFKNRDKVEPERDEKGKKVDK